ncbi:ATP-grasp domain-containing protein [Rhizobium sp. ARZ01]|uniref:acetyl/propionyl/methylcrotonyl-CoA carboxylase subunit alpha n=1 Tax=Rhizobium sp. ARZ01 TaxID=2769313 RepID=UPI00177C6212|nr:biotin carboxylase N-terminal domain-containing protein [Rhizobium sp. ARZ01]MBD9371036.1 ATP-grasp domain-containing protein [Rhizobium sp. ARZ01]
MITSLLIANRGEIACRVIRTCRKLGIRTVAVYSDADRDALHVCSADHAIWIGPSPARESYLNAQAIVDAAIRTGADAIHPGYGFLSEKTILAKLCAEAGIIFVGPSANCIELMGSKIESKQIALKAGVPSVPGYIGDDQSTSRLLDEARSIGFPLMIKASAGGGGKGMRRVMHADDLPAALDLARREAESAFGDSSVLIERLVQRPRHLEVQIAGDKLGNVVHLFERDCSVQRNHQKVLEEAPAPNLNERVRSKLFERAVALTSAIGYDSIGTVEFIYEDGQDEPWFLEMNTRLQVEHTVTEEITGTDLVEWQIRIANGEPLPLAQEQIRCSGHAIEARITAERADLGFRPEVGKISHYKEPASIRVDSGVEAGSEISLYYDSLLAKAIATGKAREEASAKLATALRDFAVLGLGTTLPFLADAVSHPIFAGGEARTDFIDIAFEGGWRPTRKYRDLARAVAAALRVETSACTRALDPCSPWASLTGFRVLQSSGGMASASVVITDDEEILRAKVCGLPNGHRVVDLPDGQSKFQIRVEGSDFFVETDQGLVRGVYSAVGNEIALRLAGEAYRLDVELEVETASGQKGGSAADGSIMTTMPGIIVDVCVADGDLVDAGQTVAVIESMKLLVSLPAPKAGRVTDLGCRAGESVRAGKRLMTIVSEDATGG